MPHPNSRAIFCNNPKKGSLHQVEVNTREGPRTITSRRLIGCPNFSSADDETKKQIFLKAKGKMQDLCQLCTMWNHDTSKCASKIICKKCNSKHWSEACALQQTASYANVGTNLIKLCVQDILAIVSSGSDRKLINARVLFDLGSQTKLVRDQFAELAGWAYTNAPYSLAGIGTSSRTIQGKLWNITLKDKECKIHITKGYGVPSILQND